MSRQGITEPATAIAVSRLLAWMVAVAVVVRGAVWVMTFGAIAPVTSFGFARLYESDWRIPVVIEVALILLTLIVAVTAAVGARRDWGHYRRRVGTLGGVFAAHTVLYLIPFVAALFLGSDVPSWAVSLVVVANIPLIVLGVRIWRQTRPLPSLSSPTS